MKIAEFAEWCVRDGPWEGCHLDGGDVQEKAVECGILVKVKYDPASHGESDLCEPGDDWYVFSDEFKSEIENAKPLAAVKQDLDLRTGKPPDERGWPLSE